MKRIMSIALLALFVFSCSKASVKKGNTLTVSLKDEGASKGNTLTINLKDEGASLDPQLLTESSGGVIHTFISEGLTRISEKTKEIECAAAESYEVSSDALEWTFHIRKDTMWENGKPVTSKDFRFAWLRALDPETASEYAYMLYYIKGAEEYNTGKGKRDDVAITCTNDKTLKVTLTAPVPYFTWLTAFTTYMPCNEEFFNKCEGSYAMDTDKFLSNGPYKVKEWVHNSSVTLVKNPSYRQAEKVKHASINIKFIPNSLSALNAYKNGELNEVELEMEQYDEYKDDAQLKASQSGGVWALLLRQDHAALKNVNIRRAVSMAIDKDMITQKIFHGIKKPLYTFTPRNVGLNVEGNKDFSSEAGNVFASFNAEEAKRLLEKGMKEEGLTQFPPTSITFNDQGSNKQVVEMIQEQLRTNLGIHVEVEALTYKERITRTHQSDFDMVYGAWWPDYHDPMTYLDLFMSGGMYATATKYKSVEYDECIAKAKSTTDSTERFNAMKKAEETLGADVPICPIYQDAKLYLIDKKLKDYALLGFGGEFLFAFSDFLE